MAELDSLYEWKETSEIDDLVEITKMSKQEIKLLSYMGKTTEEIIEISKQNE